MGQKVNPIGIRLGISKQWNECWYANARDFATILHENYKLRKYLKKKLAQAGVSRIQIARLAKNAKITVYTARPGAIIGKSGRDIDNLREEISNQINIPVQISIEEIKKPELDAYLVAENIAKQLEKRVAFRRAMKRAVGNTMKLGAKGIKIAVSGRLAGAEIARTEKAREGSVPLHTFRSDVDYGLAEAKTTYGIIGVKVWICRGEVERGTLK